MNRLKYLVIGILALTLTGCGQTVIETLNVTGGPDYNAPGSGKSIVILPFADYSEGNIESANRRSMMLIETLTDKLSANGFSLPIQEDVFDFLVKEKVIQLASYKAANTVSLDDELLDDWSDTMKAEIYKYKNKVEYEASRGTGLPPGAHSLSKKKLAKIGRHFSADYIVRGRILEYKTRDEASWAPWKKGIIPFVNGSANRIINGFASTDSYDQRNESITGSLIGARIGHTGATWPWDDGKTIWGMADNSFNSIFWGGVGWAMGGVTHTSGKVDQATVQMRVWVQEAATGNVVWTNRIRVLVSPESILADNQYDTLFNKAIEKGTSTLVEHFVTYGL